MSFVKNASVVPFWKASAQAAISGPLPTTWPSGNCTAGASPVWSTVTTTKPREARSSTSDTFQSRESPAPGEYRTTGKRPGAIAASRTEWVLVADQSTRPAGRLAFPSTAGPTAAATAAGSWFVNGRLPVWTAG